MLKVRYYGVRLGCTLGDFSGIIKASTSEFSVELIDHTGTDVQFAWSVPRQVALKRVVDGEMTLEWAETFESYQARLFQAGKGEFFLCVLEPPRGHKAIITLFEKLLDRINLEFYVEQLEITKPIIDLFVQRFESFKLVAAKVRDFAVYAGAVGRLEVASHQGLSENIAPFLENKYFVIDSVSYEITHEMKKGLITFSRNGTLRVSEPITEIVIPTFERVLTLRAD
jgi:hypothetical protein